MNAQLSRKLVVQRYQPGARLQQRIIMAFFGLLTLCFFRLAIVRHEFNYAYPAFVGLLFLGLLTTLAMRSVTFTIDPATRQMHRDLRWCGLLCSTKSMTCDEFDSIRVGSFVNRNDTLPVYWARLIGRRNYTLVESGRRKEVWNVVNAVEKITGLPVTLGRIGG